MDLTIDSSPIPISRCTRASSNSHPSSSSCNEPNTNCELSHQPRKVSRARKSLNFDNLGLDGGDKLKSNTNYDPDEQQPFRLHFPTEAESMNINASAYDPGPPALTQRSTSPRRSKRLISKCQAETFSTNLNQSFYNEESNDSGVSGSQPCSQNSVTEIVNIISKATAFDTMSVCSDYGTSSEHSFNSSFNSNSSISSLPLLGPGATARTRKREYPTRLRKRRKLEEAATKKQKLEVDLSPGYLSDIDEFKDRSPSPQGWDDDMDFRHPANNNEWDRIITEEKIFQSINLPELFPLPEVKLISRSGIHILAPTPENPLNLIIPQPQEDSDSFSHLVQIPLPCTRKRKRKINPGPIEPTSPFQIYTFPSRDVETSFLRHGLRVIPASHLISPQPFGTRFSHHHPAIISIPLKQIPAIGDEIYCLYTDTQPTAFDHDNPFLKWKVLHLDDMLKYSIEEGRLTFETLEFYTFFVVIRERPIESLKHIRTRTGGKLVVPEVPWIEVNFPKGSVTMDTTARAKIFFDTEKTLPELFSEAQILQKHDTISLASPIIMLEPHGIDFHNEPVSIRLPIPDYDAIVGYFGVQNAKLFILQSCTGDLEPSHWELLDVPFKILKSRSMTMTVIEFEVTHFSFFRVVWDLISASLYETKVGMSNYFSFVSFSMKCQANMSNQADDNRFGLEVTCFRSDKKFPEQSNYRFKVGGSNKPKMVRPGRIFVRLKSQYFVADEGAGEDASLLKEENDFRGRDFELQYCCKFNDLDKPIETGTFGKVIVKRTTKAGQEEPLFEFNLQKSGQEGEKTPYCLDQNDRWSIVALQELASNMFITDGDNWKMFAKAIGFNKNEINRLLKPAEDPFLTMINVFQHRGGSPDEFVQSIYSVHRELKLKAASPASSQKSKASNSSSGRGSLPHNDKYGRRIISSDSDTSGTQISQDSLLNGSRKRSSNNNSTSKGSREGGGSSSKKYKRRKFALRKDSSDTDEHRDHSPSPPRGKSSGAESGSDSDGDRPRKLPGKSVFETAQSISKSSIIYGQDQSKLDQKFMWEISVHIDTINWRPLGRTLGLEESKLINIENSYRNNGFRECAYQTLIAWREKYPKTCTFSNLYQALKKEGLTRVAKKMPELMDGTRDARLIDT